jgi:hypothetical protein
MLCNEADDIDSQVSCIQPSLKDLPLELLWLIASYCTSYAGINALAYCNKRLHWSFNPYLYRRDMHYGNFYALRWAASKGKTSTARRVFEYRDNITLPVTWLQIALGRAIKNCSWEIVRLLIINGTDVNTCVKGLGSVLQAVSWKGDTRLVQLLLDAGAEVNAYNGHYGSALAAAAWSGHIKVVELLLSKGADINADIGHYGNALQAASCAGHQSIVDYLIRNGAFVSKKSGFYGSALQAACWVGDEQVVKSLLQAGGDNASQSHDVKSALKVAYNRGHILIFRTILTWAVVGNSRIAPAEP